MLGLGERELQLLRQGFREMIAAERNVSLPDAVAIGDHQIGRVGAQRDDDDRRRRILRVVLFDRRQVLQLIEHDEVVNRQRRELDDIDFDARVGEWLERAEHLLALHGEQADFGLQREAICLAAAGHLLIVPDDVFQREGDLLPRFVAHDVGNLFRLDRRQLDEPRQTALAGHRDRHPVALQLVARQKLPQRVAHQLDRVGLGLAENFRVFDEVERVGRDPARVVLVRHAPQGLERALTDVDTPNRIARGHAHDILCSASVPPLCAIRQPHGPGTGRRLVRWAADTTHCSTY